MVVFDHFGPFWSSTLSDSTAAADDLTSPRFEIAEISVAILRYLSTDLEEIRLRFCGAACNFQSRDFTAV